MKGPFALTILGIVILLSSCSGNVQNYDPFSPPARPVQIEREKPDTIDNFSYYLTPKLPQEVRDVVMENRGHLFINPSSDFEADPGKYINLNYDENVDKSIVEALKNPQEFMISSSPMTFDIVEKELDFLIDYLKYAYGGYAYYGGDTAFYAMKNNILEELKAKNKDGASLKDYTDILYQHLSATAVDCHITVGDRNFRDDQRHHYFLVSEKYIFNKTDGRYYSDAGGVRWELISLDNEAPELLPYLNKDGQMVWVIGYSSTSNSSQYHTIELMDEAGSRIIKRQIKLSSTYKDIGQITNFMYYEYEQNGIKIVESRRCQVRGEKEDMFEKMGEAGKNLQGKDVVIVDLRNNSGGNSAYPRSWLEGYLGYEAASGRGLFTSRRTETTYYTSSSDDAYKNTVGAYEDFMAPGHYLHWREPSMYTPRPNTNKDTLFIVLANADTASAGEDFVDYLRQTENTIVVGTNTGGAYMTGSVTGIYLPYTQTYFRCGYNLHLEPDLSTVEGKGIQPDIWAPPRESLDRTLKFIAYYGLTEAS